MPGFMMFDEYKDMPFGAPTSNIEKAAYRRLPMTWVTHGIKGEYNIDLDPVAMLRGDGTDLMNFGEAYAAWIAVRKVRQNIEGIAKRDAERRRELNEENERSNGAGSGQEGVRKQQRTKWNKSDDPGGELEVDIEIDASLPQLIKAALEKDKKFDVAEVHMCTTAQIDLSAITPNNNSPAAALIKTLGAAMLFNIIPYFSIVMKDVTIMDVDFDMTGEQNDPPQATLKLKFHKVKWCYHIINQSNMNLIDVYAEYDYKERKKPDPVPSLGMSVVVNPFG
jgi:type VI protein secretion system component Hcp